MIVPYLSMFVLFVVPLLQLEPDEMRDLVRRLVVASLIGGIMFLALPAQLGFAERADAGIWQGLYDVIYRIDNRFNTVPSFHVIYTASILLAFIEVATPGLRWLYLAWLVVVCASTVLTHRHHLADVAAGLAIAVAVRSLFPRPMPSLSAEST
jgi:membrane-associated phospholipid phosphatase